MSHPYEKLIGECYDECAPDVEDLNNMFNKQKEKVQDIGLTNLKLYDVASYCADNDIPDEMFGLFCDDEFELFQQNLDEIGVDMEHIGRTSSFYFYPKQSNFDLDIYEVLESRDNVVESFGGYVEILHVFENIGASYDDFKLVVTEHPHLNLDDIEDDSEFEHELFGMVEGDYMVIEEQLDFFIEDTDCVYQAFELLEDFKRDQVERFKEWYEGMQ